MYIPAAFRETRVEVLHSLICEHSFGTLISLLNGQLFATHLPFLLDVDQGPNGTLRGHMARPNPHWRCFDSASDSESLVIFQGPHAYISPAWYVAEQAVPTWNYIAVHVYGTPRIIDDPLSVRQLLTKTVATFEEGSARPWSIDRVTEEYIANMARGIVAFEIPIARLEGKQKLGQNRSAADRSSAASALLSRGETLGVAIAELMLEVGPDPA
jgi:transcriptional regulator